MSDLFHECRSERGQGLLRELELSPFKTPYRGKFSADGLPSVIPDLRPPSHYQNWVCPDCHLHVMRLIGNHPNLSAENNEGG